MFGNVPNSQEIATKLPKVCGDFPVCHRPVPAGSRSADRYLLLVTAQDRRCSSYHPVPDNGVIEAPIYACIFVAFVTRAEDPFLHLPVNAASQLFCWCCVSPTPEALDVGMLILPSCGSGKSKDPSRQVIIECSARADSRIGDSAKTKTTTATRQ